MTLAVTVQRVGRRIRDMMLDAKTQADFMRNGTPCPTDGCGATLRATHGTWQGFMSPDQEGVYTLKCPRCGHTHHQPIRKP